MTTAKLSVSRFVDIKFTLRFIGLFLLFYYGNEVFVHIVGPGKVYSAFLDHYLNYLVWMKIIILNTSNAFCHWIGLDSFIIDATRLKVAGGPSVYLGLKCLGIGIISFWLAFIIAQDNPWRQKFYWSLAGLVVIFFLNCFRITLILFALSHKWKTFGTMDHHLMWNIATYIVIIILFGFYTKGISQRSSVTD